MNVSGAQHPDFYVFLHFRLIVICPTFRQTCILCNLSTYVTMCASCFLYSGPVHKKNPRPCTGGLLSHILLHQNRIPIPAVAFSTDIFWFALSKTTGEPVFIGNIQIVRERKVRFLCPVSNLPMPGNDRI